MHVHMDVKQISCNALANQKRNAAIYFLQILIFIKNYHWSGDDIYLLPPSFCLSLDHTFLWSGIFQLLFCVTVNVLFSYLCYIFYSNISIYV